MGNPVAQLDFFDEEQKSVILQGGLKLDYEFINNEKNQDCDNDYVFTKDDLEKIKIYISYNKNSVCYLRTTKTSKYNRCNDNNKILKKINNILKLNLTSIPNNLSTILIDYKL